MAKTTKRPEKRMDALSKERIVEAAIEILDAEGEGALTFRALTSRLSTGAGAIYWHLADKNELLATSANEVIARVMRSVVKKSKPRDAIRAVAIGLFDALDAHPWVGTQLARQPWQSANVEIFEAVGSQLEALGVPPRDQFDAASVLVNYILGVAGQNAANARVLAPTTGRTDFLTTVAERWLQLDAARFPFVHRVAKQLPRHDDRAQFLGGIDLVLAGMQA